MSDDRYIDKLTMTRSALDALVKAVPDQLVKEIVADNYRRAVPTPTRPQSVIDALVERFAKADSNPLTDPCQFDILQSGPGRGPNAIRSKTARIHHPSRRRGGHVAARGARAAGRPHLSPRRVAQSGATVTAIPTFL